MPIPRYAQPRSTRDKSMPKGSTHAPRAHCALLGPTVCAPRVHGPCAPKAHYTCTHPGHNVRGRSVRLGRRTQHVRSQRARSGCKVQRAPRAQCAFCTFRALALRAFNVLCSACRVCVMIRRIYCKLSRFYL